MSSGESTESFSLLLSVARDRSIEPNKTGNLLQEYVLRGQNSSVTRQAITALNSKLNTPGQLERANTKYERKRKIMFDKSSSLVFGEFY